MMVSRASSIETASQPHSRTAAGSSRPVAKIAYLVFAHQNLHQLVSLVNALDSPAVRFIIHIDSESREYRNFINEPAHAALLENTRVEFLEPRQNVRWGGYSLTSVVLRALQRASEIPTITRFRSLSGLDFPLRPTAQIEEILLLDEDSNFLIGAPPESWRIETRTEQFWHIDMLGAGRVSHYLAYLQRLLGVKRTPPAGMRVMKGPQWWTLSRAAVDYLFEFLAANPDVERFFRYSMVSDESLIQSVLQTSPMWEHVIQDSQTFDRFKPNSPNPDVLGEADLPEVLSSGKLFARKFDSRANPRILEAVDRLRHSQVT
jgi:hypothetical protein